MSQPGVFFFFNEFVGFLLFFLWYFFYQGLIFKCHQDQILFKLLISARSNYPELWSQVFLETVKGILKIIIIKFTWNFKDELVKCYWSYWNSSLLWVVLGIFLNLSNCFCSNTVMVSKTHHTFVLGFLNKIEYRRQLDRL